MVTGRDGELTLACGTAWDGAMELDRRRVGCRHAAVPSGDREGVSRETMSLSPDQRATLSRYAALVRSSPHNLLSRRALAELEQRHIPESIGLARLIPPGAVRLLDVGSGGGLPGVVIAICRPDLDVVLLEATAKKAAFLTAAAAHLGLDLGVVNQRAEAAVRGPLAGTFDAVTARAVAPLERLIPLTVPFLTPQGLVFAVKGERWRAELETPGAAEALHRHRARVAATPDDDPQPRIDNRDATPRVVMLGRSSSVLPPD